MRLPFKMLALAAAAALAAVPAAAFDVQFHINDTDVWGSLSFHNAGSGATAYRAFAWLDDGTGDSDAFGNVVADWTVSANSFHITQQGVVTAAHFAATSDDGLEWLDLNIDGVNEAAGHLYADNSRYVLGNQSGFSGVSFFFNASASSSMIPILSAPEPSTWATMMIGFFGVGALRYRAFRRSRAKPA
jgi:hypothetical protein